MPFVINPFRGDFDSVGTGGGGGTGGTVTSSDVTPIPPSVQAELGTSNNLAAALVAIVNRLRVHVHTQASASTTWTIAHNLGLEYPQITATDSAGDIIFGFNVTPIDANNLTISFDIPFSGEATLHR